MAGPGVVFNVGGAFANSTTQNTVWSTEKATISFFGRVNHSFSLAGIDKGANVAGYTNNFAWDTISIGSGDSLTLTAAGNSGYAQYVSTILGVVIDPSGQVTNISEDAGSNLNIYYLASTAGDAYLNDKTYNLTGGGELIAVNSVPIPPAILLMVPGLAGLAAMRRRVKG